MSATFARGCRPSLASLDRQKAMMLGLPIRNRAHILPWGYRLSKEDPTKLEAIEDHLRLLYKAKLLLKSTSFRKAATWLSVNTGAYISAEGLSRVLSMRGPTSHIQLPLSARLKKFHEPTNY
jgi:hypothetical protein